MKNAIQISGGIDSLALLFSLREIWDDSIVMWCDAGASYADVRKLMGRICAMVPHFMYIRGNQPGSLRTYGFPVDVVPVPATRNGETVYGPAPVLFQPAIDCCARSRFQPLHEAVLRCKGVDTVYRGQRNDERVRGQIRDMHFEDGITYRFPLAEWTREQVFDYMRTNAPDFIPEYYAKGEKTSRDCWNCTAYRRDNVERVNNLPMAQREYVKSVLLQWRIAVRDAMEPAL